MLRFLKVCRVTLKHHADGSEVLAAAHICQSTHLQAPFDGDLAVATGLLT